MTNVIQQFRVEVNERVSGRVGRVRSEDNVADLGTKPLSKAVIAKHCLALGYVNMNQENV